MHFDQTHPPTPSLPSQPLPYPPTTLPFPYQLFLCCLYECGYRTIYWGQGSLSGPTSLNKTDSPSPSSRQLPTAPQFRGQTP